MREMDIIEMAEAFETHWHTKDPYEICKKLGIIVMHIESTVKSFTAHTVKIEGYPTIISINNAYDENSRRLLCAHELGHALLHDNGVNHFAVTRENVMTDVEREANLFALALMGDENFRQNLIVPLEKMEGYLLRRIMDLNLKMIEK